MNENVNPNDGPTITAQEVGEFIDQTFDCNQLDPEVRFALCIMGIPGIGKTAVIKGMKNHPVTYKGKEYPGYRIIYLALAQFEEMGDFQGLPEKFCVVQKDGVSKLIRQDFLQYHLQLGWAPDINAEASTGTDAPIWVPKEDVPTILLLDDWNRASSRIITGIMQLLQFGGLGNWKLPQGTIVCLTGNPDNDSGYLVQTLDDAIYGRLECFTLEANVEQWCKWAMTQPNLSQAGISFARQFPEMVMSNKRSPIRDWSAFCVRLYRMEQKGISFGSDFAFKTGVSRVGEGLASRFFSWVEEEYNFSLSPDVALSPKGLEELHKVAEQGRQDIVFLSCERLISYIVKADYKALKGKELQTQIKNFQNFMTSSDMPPDSRNRVLALLEDAAKGKSAGNIAQWFTGNELLLKEFLEVHSLNGVMPKDCNK